MSKTIKIAKIIDETSFIINAGSDENIQQNDKFEIAGANGIKVRDPDTNEVLGKIEAPKGVIYISKVYEKMSLARTKFINDGTEVLSQISTQKIVMSGINGIYGQPKEREELNVDPSQITGGLNNTSTDPIRIGDIVKPI